MKHNIFEALTKRILVLDGAMGTMIQRHDLSEDDFRNKELATHAHALKGNNDLLTLTRPDIISEIHRLYLEAGADIVETNTFCSTNIAQSDYGLEHLVFELNKQAAMLAKQETDRMTAITPEQPRWVAGSIGPTNRTASLSPKVTDPGFRAVNFDQLVSTYTEQVLGLIAGGVDILLVETIFDTLNAKAALFAIQEVFEQKNITLPVMVSGTITDASGRTLSGQTTEAFLISLQHVPLLSIGLNCALGAEAMRPYLHVLHENAPFAVSAHPNAGLPNEMGAYDESPEQMAAQIQSFLEEGLLNIIGGCCGTTPEHIKAIAAVTKKYQPRTAHLAVLR
jgi:5-methyltetrahydrofolate--homocysteine methyltransferase